MNRVFTGRGAWLTALGVAYFALTVLIFTAGSAVSKEVIDVSRLTVFAIICGTYAPTGIHILKNGLTAPKWHGLLGISALGAAVFIQGALIFARRMLDRPDWLTNPAIDVVIAFNITLAGLLFLSGPHLADAEMPRRSFRWVIVAVGILCVCCGIIIGRYLAPG